MKRNTAFVLVISVALGGWISCSTEFGGTGVPPCDLYNADPLCGEACVVDGDCGPDLYCGLDGLCTADCSPDGGQCAEGQICVAHGRCINDPGDGGLWGDATFPDAAICGNVTVSLAPVIPTVVVLIDQSGSMTSSFGSQDRWAAVTEALTDPGGGVITQLEADVIFGATLYTSNGGFGGGACPILSSVPPALNNLTAIDNLLTTNSPAGDTPTGESIDEVVQQLLNLPPNPEGPDSPPIIVVATDGEPDTCTVPNPQEGQPESVAAAEASYQAGIDLFILSVGSGVSDAHLQDMANAGVGLPVGGTDNAPYYVANDQGQLVDAFNEIIHGARSCEFVVEGIVIMDRADEGRVVLNGQTLEYGTEWNMVDESTMVLLGAACDTFLSEENVSLVADFPCDAVVQ